MHCSVSIARMVSEGATMLHFTCIACIFWYRHTNIYEEHFAAICTLKREAVGFSENWNIFCRVTPFIYRRRQYSSFSFMKTSKRTRNLSLCNQFYRPFISSSLQVLNHFLLRLAFYSLKKIILFFTLTSNKNSRLYPCIEKMGN